MPRANTTSSNSTYRTPHHVATSVKSPAQSSADLPPVEVRWTRSAHAHQALDRAPGLSRALAPRLSQPIVGASALPVLRESLLLRDKLRVPLATGRPSRRIRMLLPMLVVSRRCDLQHGEDRLHAVGRTLFVLDEHKTYTCGEVYADDYNPIPAGVAELPVSDERRGLRVW